ncbi:hypothetical protein FACS189415_5050 [Bacteroidia bacterium]|nr:hypothetical protein FACS189415_5050 [Bacteroidia bacterium]
MKLLALLIMLAALFLLYRIAYPKQADTKKGNDTAPPEKPKVANDVMGKSRFVLPDRSKPLQTPATLSETETTSEKPVIFAAETEEKPSGIIPSEELDEVFADEPNPEILSIPLDDDDEEIDYEAEEEEAELGRTLGHEAVMAEGIDYDKLQTAVKAVMEQPEDVSEETGRTIVELENTDMFEMLVSGDEGKMNWIKAVVERNIQKVMPETEDETSDANFDYGDFDVADYVD